MSETPDIEAIVRDLPAGRNPELRLWLRLLSCTNLITAEVRQRLRSEFGLTLPQFDLMAQLYRQTEGLRLSELSRRMMVSNGNLTGLVDRLLADGLVARETDSSDRRAFVVRLTERGTEEFAKVARVHERWIRQMFSGLDESQLAELTTDLGVLKTSVRAARARS